MKQVQYDEGQASSLATGSRPPKTDRRYRCFPGDKAKSDVPVCVAFQGEHGEWCFPPTHRSCFELWQFMPTIKPLNHAKQPLRAKLQQVQMERVELGHKLG